MKDTTRRHFVKMSLAAGSAAAFAGPACLFEGNGGSSKPPNLVFVFPDQMRGQALGFMKEDPVITPNLDRFAGESVAFTHAVSNYPVCSPYRGMLMTGKFPHANRVLSNCNTNGAKYGYELQASDRCWSDVLRDRGYSLGYIGKWHLDSPRKPWVKSPNNSEAFAWNEWCPPERRHGFDFWYAYGTYDNHFKPEYWTNDSTRDERVKIDQWSPEHEADMAIRYIRNGGSEFRHPDRPFALVVGMNPPHMPYHLVSRKYVAQYGARTAEELLNRPNVNLKEDTKGARLARKQIKNYFAMVTGVDDQFGRILAALKEAGLEKDTLVVFTSDHGNCLGCHEQVSKNVHYEESMRVPFLIRWPGKIRPRRDNLLLSTPDIYPTLLDLMGFGSDIPEEVDGVSHASILTTGSGPRPASQLYMWIPCGKPAWGRRGVRTHRYTMVVTKEEGMAERIVLHDNVEDPYQLKNIATGRPAIVKRLREKELAAWLENTGDPWAQS
jgi:arylsulfatase A-like enzyme